MAPRYIYAYAHNLKLCTNSRVVRGCERITEPGNYSSSIADRVISHLQIFQ